MSTSGEKILRSSYKYYSLLGFTLDPETGLQMAEVTGMSYIAWAFRKSTFSHVTDGLKA